VVVFNLGGGEIVVLAVLGLIFLGPEKLPELWQTMRARFARFDRSVEAPPPWTWARHEWLLVGGILLLGTLALSLAAARG
jgi:hypothetical protein